MLEPAEPPRQKEDPVQRSWGRTVPAELGNQHRGPSGWNRVRRDEDRDGTGLAATVTVRTHVWPVKMKVCLQLLPDWGFPGGKPGIHLGPYYDWRPGQGWSLIHLLNEYPCHPRSSGEWERVGILDPWVLASSCAPSGLRWRCASPRPGRQ